MKMMMREAGALMCANTAAGLCCRAHIFYLILSLGGTIRERLLFNAFTPTIVLDCTNYSTDCYPINKL
jgi:hypothetical protein